MTVQELKEKLNKYPDDTEIVMGYYSKYRLFQEMREIGCYIETDEEETDYYGKLVIWMDREL